MIRKVLFLTEDFSFPPMGGGQIRDRYLIELLREKCEVEILTFRSKLDLPLPKGVSVHNVPTSPISLLRKTISVFRPYFINGYNFEMERMIGRRASPDTILWASRLSMGKYLHLGSALGLKTILDEHNVESRVLIHYALKGPSSWIYLPRALWSRRCEGQLCDAADITVVTSQDDADRLKRLTQRAEIRVIPNCIDVSRYGGTSPARFSLDYLFLGSLNYGPNVEGLLWFTRKVLPELRTLLKPDQPRIMVAGSNPSPPLLQELKSAGIQLEINPSTVASTIEGFLAKTSVVFIPLLFGSGTRIKIIEAMAAGRPVISTPIGAEGLGLKHGNGIWIASTVHEFANGMKLLLKDASQRERIASEASRIASTRFDWRVMKPSLENVLESLTA